MSENWMMVSKAARELELSTASLYKLMEQGRVNYRRIGKFYHIEFGSLLRARANKQRPGRPAPSPETLWLRAFEKASARLKEAEARYEESRAEYDAVVGAKPEGVTE